IYGRVYEDANLRKAVRVVDLLEKCDRNWKLVMLGDALMHPAELIGNSWSYAQEDRGRGDLNAIGWFGELAKHFDRTAWLNPEPSQYWNGTADLIAKVFPMYQLTLDGLDEAVRHLSRRSPLR
ncbi:MAG: VWA containing CoxE family protein, partial [Polyangiales bacterium]